MKRFFLFIFFTTVCFWQILFANYDTVNSSNTSCSVTKSIAWTPLYAGWSTPDPYKECSGTQTSWGTQQLTWSCHYAGENCSPPRANDQWPNCWYNSACAAHKWSGACVSNNNWSWSSKTCRPRFNCLDTPGLDLTHAHAVSDQELPLSYTLSRDFSESLVSYEQETSAYTNDTKCEYTCDSGYVKKANTCVPLVCAGQKPSNGIMCNNIVRLENFSSLKSWYLKTGFWRFDTFKSLPSTYTPNGTNLSGLVLPAPAEGTVPLYMFYRAAPLLFLGPWPYQDEVYYSTDEDPPYGMTLATDYPGGVVGYVYTSGGPDRKPIYEFSDATATHHMWANAPVTGWTKVSSDTTVTSTDDTQATYNNLRSINIAIKHNLTLETDTTDKTDETTQSFNDGKAYFTVTISNPLWAVPLDTISVVDALVPECSKTAAQITAIMATAGKVTSTATPAPTAALLKNAILEPGESFSYDCSSTALKVTPPPAPNDKNSITVSSLTADTFNAPVSATNTTGATFDATRWVEIVIEHDTRPTVETDVNDRLNINSQSINDGKWFFKVIITNPVTSTVAIDTISTVDVLVPGCNRTAATLAAMINALLPTSTTFNYPKNTVLDPGESIFYYCVATGISAPFTDNLNTITVSSLTADTFNAPVSATNTTGATFDATRTINIAIKHNLTLETDTTDKTDETTQSFNDGKAYFTVTISNPLWAVPLDTISVVDALVPECSKTAAQITAIMATAGKVTSTATPAPTAALLKNAILEPGESFSYDCSSTALKVTPPPAPNDKNSITVSSLTADTFNAPVSATNTTGATFDATRTINIAIKHNLTLETDTTDKTDETTQSFNDGKAYFTVTISNPLWAVPLDTISVVDALVPECSKTAAQITAIMATAGKVTSTATPAPTAALLKNAILEPGESFSYDCSSTALKVTPPPAPNDKNSITVSSLTADTFNAPVSATNTTGATFDATRFHIKFEILNGNAFDATTGVEIGGVDQEKQIIVNGKAKFFVRITNDGDVALDTISTTNLLAPTCSKTAAQITAIMATAGKVTSTATPAPTAALLKNAILEPGESFWYACETQGTAFPDDTNVMQIRATSSNLFDVPVNNEASTIASYTDKPSVKIEIMSNKNNPQHLNSNDSQTVEGNGIANFYIRISNNGFVPLNNISTTSVTAPGCNRTVAQLGSLIKWGNTNTILGDVPGEYIEYTCDTTGIIFPDNKNTIGVKAKTVNINNSDTPVFYALDANYFQTLRAQNPPTIEKWEAYMYSSAFIMLTKHPIDPNTVAGQTFYIYNPDRIIYNMTKEAFLADPEKAIQNAMVLPIGNVRYPHARLQFNMPQLLSETATMQTTVITNFYAYVYSRFLCKTLAVGAKDCHSNNLGAYVPGISYTPTGPIYSSVHDGDGYVQYTPYQRLGTFDVEIDSFDYLLPSTNPDDTYLWGNQAVSYNNVADSTQCTNQIQCEFYCPTDLPFYCSSTNSCVTDENSCIKSCGEWEYYCAAQWACIPGSSSCSVSSTTLILWENNVTPTGVADCPGTYSGGLCTTQWKIRVNFSEPFDGAPAVFVAPEKVSDQLGCVWNLTDKVVAIPENISGTGFDLRIWGSPYPPNCGTGEGSVTYATAGWIAIGKRASGTPQKIVAQSEHDINLGLSTDCPWTFSGTCSDYWKRHITFTKPFKTIPKVLVSGENVSTATGGATRMYRFYPENITTTGFDIRGGGYWDYLLPATVGYIALGEVLPENEATSDIISKALVGTFEGSTGQCHGAFSGGLCMGAWDKTITFDSAFENTPHMFVAPAETSSQWGCVGWATDKIYNTATDITSLGFLGTTQGSPLTGSCGSPWDSWASISTMSWFALGSEQSIVTCNHDGQCSGEESCNCDDCNNKTDHCENNQLDIQLSCTQDTTVSPLVWACCPAGTVWSSVTRTCFGDCDQTQAPSEIKAGYDQPYISCLGSGDITQTHFKYRLMKINGASSELEFISPEPEPIGTQILHPTLTQGEYKVECFYGTESSVPTDVTALPHMCTKTITVKPTTETNVQWCDAIYSFKNNTLEDEIDSPSPYNARYRCAYRVASTTSVTDPFQIKVESELSKLGYDDMVPTFLVEMIGTGRISIPSWVYPLTASSTDVECAVKIGSGYSTNPSCQISPQITNRCEEGKYFCSAEALCKDADESCSIPVCNNDNVCDTYESCNCADCNTKIDHCAVNSEGQQLMCAKDTEIPAVCEGRAESIFNTIETKLAPYMSQQGNLNIAAGEFGTAQTELEMTQDTQQQYFSSFTKDETWIRVKELLWIPVSTNILWTRSSNLYSNTAYGWSHRYIYSYVIEQSGIQRQITYATEYLLAYGWRKIYLINKVFPLIDINGQCLIETPTIQNTSFQRFDTQSSFTAANTSPTIIGYDALSGRLPSYVYTFPGTGVTIRPNDSGYSTNNLLVSDLSTALPGKEIYVTGKEHFEINFSPAVNAFGFDFNESTTCRAGFCPTTSVESTFIIRVFDGEKKLQEYMFTPENNVATFFGTASKQPFDRVSIQEITGTIDDEAFGKMYIKRDTDSLCQPYTSTWVIYTPNVSPVKQSWSHINGIGTAQNDAGKLVWQVNDGGTSEGNNAVIYKKLASTELDDFFTKGGKYSVQLKNLSASAPTSSAAALLASYIEIARGKNTTKGERRFTFVFGLDADKTPNIIGLTDNGTTYTTPTNSTYKYKVTGGADKYNLYEMLYDPATDTVDLFVNGVERISDFPGNTVDPGYAATINGTAAAIFGSGSSPGVAKTNYGDVQLTIKNASCTPIAWLCPAEQTYPVDINVNWNDAWTIPHKKIVDLPAGDYTITGSGDFIKCQATNCGNSDLFIYVNGITPRLYSLSETSNAPVAWTINKTFTLGAPSQLLIYASQSRITGSITVKPEHCLPAITAPVTTSTAPSNIQTWACCPPGSAWNSSENRCVPSTCWVWQFYCAAQKKCLPGWTTCDTTVCNNNGLCEWEESCQCGDCVDGPTQTDPTKKADDKDKCSIIGWIQAMCSDDIPTDNKPGACCLPPQTWNTATGTCQECTNTQAPSELKAGVDQPYISCKGDIGDATKTHFKYKLTKTSDPPEAAYISTTPVANGDQILHTVTPLSEWTYRVECFYGTSSSVDTTTTPAHACTKNIQVKAPTDTTAQWCSRILPYRDTLLTSNLTSELGFSASFRCGSRLPVVSTTVDPYEFRLGTPDSLVLPYDSIISDFFNSLLIGPVSIQTPSYDLTGKKFDVSCATKVGDWYSTNSACKVRVCSGSACSKPNTFSVVNTQNITCTTQPQSDYDIGCNDEADGTTQAECINWLNRILVKETGAENDIVTIPTQFKTYFVFDGVNKQIDCTKYPPGGMPGGLNIYGNIVCTTSLPNGETVEILGAEFNPDTNSVNAIAALQTTTYTVKRDSDIPQISDITYYKNSSLSASARITDATRWNKNPVTAVVNCANTPPSDGKYCVCSQNIAPASTNPAILGTTTPELWSVGTADLTIWADLMRYTRTITSSLNGATVAVRDTAWNVSTTPRSITIGVDTVPPTLNITATGTSPNLVATITATDNAGWSGIWKDDIQTQIFTDTDPIPEFDDKCNSLASDSLLYEAYNPSGTPLAMTKTSVPIALDIDTQKMAYCIQDNAGNIVKGFYPNPPVSCFSATNLPSVSWVIPVAIPNIATYEAPLVARITGATPQYGYGMSENQANANCFRSIIASNVTRLISNQYNSSQSTILNWADAARIKSVPTQSNTNGYYYHSIIPGNLLNINDSPTGTWPKVVYAEGADIQINVDITYQNAAVPNTLLVIIAKRATAWLNPAGGNIYINPSVKNIDAILIADGALMNGIVGTPKDYITNPGELTNRLVISGRLYSMNTRWGSLMPNGTTLEQITTDTGKIFANNASLITNATPSQAAAQDLERFRIINDDGVDTRCSLFVNYKSLAGNQLPEILTRPSNFAGGSCGF